MPLIQFRQITLGYGGSPLLDALDGYIDSGERVCLLGRNGTGKTTLMRVLAGGVQQDSGEIITIPGTACSFLPQDIPDDLVGSVGDVIHSGVCGDHHEEQWETDRRLDALMDEMELLPEVDFSSLSGGLKRRTLLARALAGRPDVLMLDEPTNHLDVETILWMEDFLLRQKMALFFVTHDRAFLRRLATRIVELDRGRMTSWPCDYDAYLERRAAQLEAEKKQWATFDKKLAQEESWLRQGVKARRTRNEGRVKALERMRDEFRNRRTRQGTARIGIQAGSISGQKVAEVKNASFQYGETPIIRNFSTVLWRGDKIGILGKNGCGKTTLLRLLLGQLTPNDGEIVLGTQLQIVYLDQLRGEIDGEKTVAENVAGLSEMVQFQGQSRHIRGYLQDFLFPPDRIRMAAKWLSGGEKNRLLLAKLFLQPANVLVLDEPTNDLDAETLELLENLLVEYEGTLILVSHDREFLDHVVSGLLVFEGDGIVGEYPGGYQDWLRMRHARDAADTSGNATAPAQETATGKQWKKERPKKMLNRERAELERLPVQIEEMERKMAGLTVKLGEPELYQKNTADLLEAKKELTGLETAIATAYKRWAELDASAKNFENIG